MNHKPFIRRFGLIFILPVMLFLSACGSDEATEESRHASIEDVNTVHIDHGSTPLQLEVADIDSLEASLVLPRGGDGLVMDESPNSVDIRLKSNISQLLNLGKKPRLRILIPSHFEGKVVVQGSSGSVTGTGLRSHSLDIQGKSGNIKLQFAELNNDLNVSVHSGNVHVQLEDSKPNASWRLQSTSGRRSIAFPLDKQSEQKQRTEGITGSGSVEVNIETRSGNITVE